MELHEMAGARANIYQFLYNLFAEPPSEELMAQLRDEEFLAHVREVFGSSDKALAAYVEELPSDESPVIEALRLEFDALFRVPGPAYATPYESVYCDGAGQSKGPVWGPSTGAVKRFYEQMGAGLAQDYPELPDYIGAELDFMRFLCTQEGAAWAEGDAESAARYLDAQNQFLREHLGRWVEPLTEVIKANAQTGFYRGLAEMTCDFVIQDAVALRLSLGEEQTAVRQ